MSSVGGSGSDWESRPSSSERKNDGWLQEDGTGAEHSNTFQSSGVSNLREEVHAPMSEKRLLGGMTDYIPNFSIFSFCIKVF